MNQEPNYQVVTLEDFLEATKHLDHSQEGAADFYTMDGRAYDMKTGSPTGRIMFMDDRQHDAIERIHGKSPRLMVVDDLLCDADFAALEQRILDAGIEIVRGELGRLEGCAIIQSRGQSKPNMQAAFYEWILGVPRDIYPEPQAEPTPPKKRMPYYHGRRRF